jgi:hypothetical protein
VILAGIVLLAAMACFFVPPLLIGVGVLLVVRVGARLLYGRRERFIPNLYARDIAVYDGEYQAFIRNSMSDLRGQKIDGHTLLWEASQLPAPSSRNSNELLLDLGVWLGWSTRLTADASGRKVYGFDTFSGLVEDWQIDDQALVKSGTFALTEPLAERLMSATGVTLDDEGVPLPMGRDVGFIKGMTYDTLEPFLAEHADDPIRLFHMDLDTYESCIHALEVCKDHFIEGSILVFDEYLVTNGELLAFYEFQKKYGLEWKYRAWGLEMWEMNVEMVKSPLKRMQYRLIAIAVNWGIGNGAFAWAFYNKRFWRFWLGAPAGDIAFMLGAAGSRKSVSLEITGLGSLDPARELNNN